MLEGELCEVSNVALTHPLYAELDPTFVQLHGWGLARLHISDDLKEELGGLKSAVFGQHERLVYVFEEGF